MKETSPALKTDAPISSPGLWKRFLFFLVDDIWRPVVEVLSSLSTSSVLKNISIGMRDTAPYLIRIRFSSVTAWSAIALVGFSVTAYFIGVGGYRAAHSGQAWLIHVWDNVILPLYSLFGFHHHWWFAVPAAILMMIFFAKPWSLHRIGGWSQRHRLVLVGYALLYTLFVVLAWQLAYSVVNVFWFFAVLLAFVCHFSAFVALALFSSLANRSPYINARYIETTKATILESIQFEGKSVLDKVLGSSLYGYLVRRASERLFGVLLGKWVTWLFRLKSKGRSRLNKIRDHFVSFVEVISLAWLFNKLFAERYYVMHFEMVLRQMLTEEKYLSWITINRVALDSALTGSLESQMLRKDASGGDKTTSSTPTFGGHPPNQSAPEHDVAARLNKPPSNGGAEVTAPVPVAQTIDAQEKLALFVRLKRLACEYFTGTGEASMLWNALEEIDSVLDYLELYRDLSLAGHVPQELVWIGRQCEEGREIRKMTSDQLVKLLSNRRPGTDPVMLGRVDVIESCLKFRNLIHETFLKLTSRDRLERFGEPVHLFRQTYGLMRSLPLDSLLKKAEDDMQSQFGLDRDEFQRIVPDLSFADRTLLQNRGIFRISQERRHLVFSRKGVPRHLLGEVYRTLSLDDYLLCRDIVLTCLRQWGRSIPYHYNHYIIKYYNEPEYWDNRHVSLADVDHLRLGLAYYQYSMELIDKGGLLTTMIYRNALWRFKKADATLPELGERLWGT